MDPYNKITETLNRRFWFGGRAYYPWEHPVNRIKNCLAITLDGSIAFKFKVHKNGKLRLMKYRKEMSQYIAPLPIKPLSTVTVKELCGLLEKNCNVKYSANYIRNA